MSRHPQLTGRTNVIPMILLGAFAICAVAEVVKASSFSDEFHGKPSEPVSSTHAKSAGYTAHFLGREQADDEPLAKGNKIQTAQFIGRLASPEGLPLAGLGRFGPPPFGMASPPLSPPRFAPRNACFEDINRQMAMHGYVKSMLQLTDAQKAGWKGLDDALEAQMPKLRAVCETLPNDVVGSPGIMERNDFMERRLASQLELVRALKLPTQQLLGLLTPDQRTSLDGLYLPFL